MPRSFGQCWAIGNRNQALLGYQCLHRGSVLSNRHGPDRYAIMPGKCAAPPALQAFGVNSVDYLLKPVEAQQLDRALQKIDRIRNGAEPRPEIWQLLAQLQAAITRALQSFPTGSHQEPKLR